MIATTDASARAEAIRAAMRELLAARRLRQRDAAQAIGVAEGEVVASRVGDGVVRLDADALRLLERVGSVGRVMALTRNEHCVHEKTGVYENLSAEGKVGLALGEDIDLRLFFSHWHHAFAVTDDSPRGMLRSLQFYDAAGEAVHKIYLRDGGDVAAWLRMVEDCASGGQRPGLRVQARTPAAAERPDALVDAQGLRAAWAAMTDTHEFFGMLRRFQVTRTQALRLAGREFARPVARGAAGPVLDAVAASALPIMIFVGNPGCIQIHTGPVASIRRIDRWLNVLDPGFSLHLHEEGVVSAWVVRKPTADGIVTSLELFDATGGVVAMLFGKRKPGIPELPEWPATLERVLDCAAPLH